jgi:hypothetical protein
MPQQHARITKNNRDVIYHPLSLPFFLAKEKWQFSLLPHLRFLLPKATRSQQSSSYRLTGQLACLILLPT